MKKQKTIKSLIKESGNRGLTMRELSRLSYAFNNLSEDEKVAVLNRIIKNGKAALVNLGKGFSGRGRDRIAYVHPDFLIADDA